MAIWALPENIEDLLPADAAKLERMRRTALDMFAAHGYELVMPPLLEYVESLLSGVGHDMDLATFKLVDQLSGRMMGIRADTTPQVARIDAHVLNRDGVARLCYAGSVLHTRPSSLGKSRQPFQAGAELYGHAGLDADIEIQQLMLDTLRAVGVRAARLDIGHPQIFRTLADEAKLDAATREAMFAAVEGKDMPALDALVRSVAGASSTHAAAVEAIAAIGVLPTLYGEVSDKAGKSADDVIARARATLPTYAAITNALDQLARIVTHFTAQGVRVSVDLGELGGFNYESGIVFAAFADGAADAVARGGRYDDIGRVFGRARAATGFTMDLKNLLALVPDAAARNGAILAPAIADMDASARAAVDALRARGEIVIGRLDGAASAECTSELKNVNGQWVVQTR